MIPIYLQKNTLKSLKEGKIRVRLNRDYLTIDDLLMYSMAKSKVNTGINIIRKGDKVLMKVDKNKEIDYNDILSDLTSKQTTFFILYNSKNYFNDQFGMSPYLNEDLAFMLACVPEDQYENYGHFMKYQEKKEVEQDSGYDKIMKKENTTLGKFQFNTPVDYVRIHRQAIALKNNAKIKEANAKLLEYFVGDSEEIKNLTVKTTVDILKNSDSDATRLKASELLGKWYDIGNVTSNTKVNVILESINVAEAIKETEEEF